MKRGIAGHVKTEELAAQLGLPIGLAVGVLEMLCNQWAPRCAPRGDVGKWTDEQIARGLRCDIPSERLIPALVASGWLEPHPRHRLVIHDYHQHADQGVRKHLKRNGERFASGRAGVRNPSGEHPDSVRTRSTPRARVTVTVTDTAEATAMASGKAPEPFDRFWLAYPRKKAKGAALKAWGTLAPDAALVEAICAAVERQSRSLRWRSEPQFIPYPATWLRARQWEDEPDPLPLTTGKTATNIEQAAAWVGGQRDAG